MWNRISDCFAVALCLDSFCVLQQAGSLLTFEGASFVGSEAIVKKFVELPFKSIQHDIKSCDCAPSAAGILVFVTGDLKVRQHEHAKQDAGQDIVEYITDSIVLHVIFLFLLG
jgi:hypothetical protein